VADPGSEHVSLRAKLSRSFISITIGLLILVMVAAVAALLIATSPLWLWLAPTVIDATTAPEAEAE
jgi:hypothetical protein